ncbi:MAG: NADH:flavin oxidoreductase [Polyangiaceae bacterium]|nr:NADH:flavin oxidoreductase [Polyangiaceae bacterium]
MAPVDVFEPATLGPLRLRNRVIKAATYEGMSPGGHASPALVAFHRRLAAGKVGLTTVAYCAVSREGRTFDNQLVLSAESRRVLGKLTKAVHDEDGKASLQLGHAGTFSKVRGTGGRAPCGPSFALNAYGVSAGLPFARAMDAKDIADVVRAFGEAAATAVELGFDAVEVHLGHGYLLSQFLSPATNRRTDEWGGSIANRMRLPLAVLEAVRKSVGSNVAVIAKTNLSDGFEGGLDIDDAVTIAQTIEKSGTADAIVPSGGFTSRTPFYLLRGGLPLRKMADAQPDRLSRVAMRVLGGAIIDRYDFEPSFFLPLARHLRSAVKLPLGLLGGVVSKDDFASARAEGFDFVVLGRALIADPDLVERMQRGEISRTRCNACNECVAEMDIAGVRCTLDR